ncbi:hypothetical protein N836_13560 [Leptolyngbya sp. Heron Island J]|nr:hypothetical protein N836_13560 [Leptolyngbya sp. Heron Island J]
MDFRKSYWNELGKLRAEILYLKSCQVALTDRTRSLQMCMAVIGSGSLASWTVWNDPISSNIWASIIVFTQVVTVISPYLTWTTDAKAISDAIEQLNPIFHDMEATWVQVIMSSDSEEEEVRKLFSEFTKRINLVLDQNWTSISVKPNRGRRTKAIEDSKLYLKKYM